MNIEMAGELILGGALKGTCVVLVGLLIAWRWKRGAAADRHTLWVLVLASFLILPLVQQWGPRWQALPNVSGAAGDEQRVVPLESRSSVVEESVRLEPRIPPIASTASIASGAAISSDSIDLSLSKALPWWAIVWMSGVAIVLGRVVVGRMALWMYGKQPENGKMQVFANRLRDRLGITRPVEIVVSERRRMPMTWGWRRPKILLPTEAGLWEEDRLEVVLLHELAHVKRRDAVTQSFVQIVTAIFWFHPLVWLAVWRLVGERERACDQAVVDEGVKPSNYARQLMAVALEDTSPLLCPSAGMGMARKGELEKRVQTLLETKPRRRMNSRWVVATVCGWIALMCPLALLTAQDQVNDGTAPPTLEGDLLANGETTVTDAALPKVDGWSVKLRQLNADELRELNGGNSVDSSPELRVEFTSDRGADSYQVRDFRLLVDGLAYGLRESQDWSGGLSPARVPTAHHLSLGRQGWELLNHNRGMDVEWLPGKHSVQIVFTLESNKGEPSSLFSNAIVVNLPTEAKESSGVVEAERPIVELALSAKQAEALAPRYVEALLKLEQLSTKYGVKHPKMIEQQRLVDSLKNQMLPASVASPIGDRQVLEKRYEQEVEKLGELGTKYLHRHPKIIQQKALVGEIESQLSKVQEVVRVASAASGIVAEVKVVRNQVVRQGAVLLTLDQRRARLAFESSMVQLKLARRKLETVAQAFKAGQADRIEYSEVEAQLKLAETASAVAKIDLEDLTVRSPADGVVLEVDAKVGEYVSPEQPVVHLKPQKP